MYLLYKIRCNPIAPPVSYVWSRFILGALVAHRYTFAPSRYRTSQYTKTYISLLVYLWNDLGNHLFDGVGLAGFKSRANMPFYWPSCSLPFCLILFSLSFYGLVLWGWGLYRMLIALSQPCIAAFFNNNNNYYYYNNTIKHLLLLYITT